MIEDSNTVSVYSVYAVKLITGNFAAPLPN